MTQSCVCGRFKIKHRYSIIPQKRHIKKLKNTELIGDSHPNGEKIGVKMVYRTEHLEADTLQESRINKTMLATEANLLAMRLL